MATLAYTTGNGYYCYCCRRTSSGTIWFDNIDELIHECVYLAESSDFDFCVDTVYDYDGDADAIDNQISLAVEKRKSDIKRKSRIVDIERIIGEIDSWFKNLETDKQTKATRRQVLAAELAQLKAEDN